MAFDLVVLGASGTYPGPGAACSGFLLRCRGVAVWIDAGPGSFANLQRHTGFHDLRGVILSHLHLDHVTDIYPFYYGLKYSPESRGPRGIEVYAPAGAEEHLAALLPPPGEGKGFEGYLEFRTVRAGDELDLGPFHFRFESSRHPIETLAMLVEAEGRALVYTSDTGPSPELAAFARGADLLITEATVQAPAEGLESVHMAAEQAGAMAAQAGVGRLVLTHIMPGLDPEVSIAQATKSFAGEIDAAADHLLIEV